METMTPLAPIDAALDAALVAAPVAARRCDRCGTTGDDCIKRGFETHILARHGFERKNERGVSYTFDPVLCTACCATMPGREWMAGK